MQGRPDVLKSLACLVFDLLGYAHGGIVEASCTGYKDPVSLNYFARVRNLFFERRAGADQLSSHAVMRQYLQGVATDHLSRFHAAPHRTPLLCSNLHDQGSMHKEPPYPCDGQVGPRRSQPAEPVVIHLSAALTAPSSSGRTLSFLENLPVRSYEGEQSGTVNHSVPQSRPSQSKEIRPLGIIYHLFRVVLPLPTAQVCTLVLQRLAMHTPRSRLSLPYTLASPILIDAATAAHFTAARCRRSGRGMGGTLPEQQFQSTKT